MKFKLNWSLLKFLTFLTIGLVSIGFIYLRTPTNKIFMEGGEILSSDYGVGFYDNSKQVLLSTSPLNDFYYQGSSQYHLLNKIEKSNDNILKKIWQDLGGIFLDKKSFSWQAFGKNSDGEASSSYEIIYSKGNIKIERNVMNKKVFDAIGETYVICANCIVADSKNRVYYNFDLLTQEKIDLASRLNLVPVILSGDQFFPKDVSRILILDRSGKTKIEIPISGEQVFLQEKWHQIEFKVSVKSNVKNSVKQVIYFHL